jgi:ABC-type lipoprotein export system ATPase subunit
MDLLRRIATEHDAAVIVVTHDESLFDRFDRIFHLRDGRLVAPQTTAATSPHQAASEATSTVGVG